MADVVEQVGARRTGGETLVVGETKRSRAAETSRGAAGRAGSTGRIAGGALVVAAVGIGVAWASGDARSAGKIGSRRAG